MKVSGKQYETFLTPIKLSRLPSEILLEWARRSVERESDLDWLLKFLLEEIKSFERSEGFSDVTIGKHESPGMNEQCKTSPSSSRFVRERFSTASALHATSPETSNPRCVFCTKRFKSEKCMDVLRLPDKERVQRIKLAGVCFKCLPKRHLAKGCFSKCTNCGGRHNVLVCGIRFTVKSDSNGSVRVTGAEAPKAGPVITNETDYTDT